MTVAMTNRRRWLQWHRLALVGACVVLLAACTAQPVRKAPPVAATKAQQTQLAREAALRADTHWSLRGRVALSNGDDGGSGRIDWQQAAARYAVSLSAPITRQSWRLSGDGRSALLEGLEGGPRHGRDPARLLQLSTGWRIPVIALASWLRGARADALGPARLQFGVDGRLLRIEQGGWTIEYRDWRLPQAAGGEVTDIPGKPGVAAARDQTGAVALPHWLQATRGTARVRLVVDHWGADAELP